MRPRNTLSRSGISTPPLAPPRDPDLLDTDQWLTPADLDDIWEWFHTALSQNVDTEFVFVKVVNAVGARLSRSTEGEERKSVD